MATALPTVAVSLVYLLWDACRRTHRREEPPPPATAPDGNENIEHRLDCLTVMVKHLPRR